MAPTQGQEQELRSPSAVTEQREKDMTKALVKTQIRLRQLAAKGETGQGTLEYIGMIIVAAVIVVFVITAARGTNLGTIFTREVAKVTGA